MPIVTEVGLSQLRTELPVALPTGTRCEAMPPIAVPSANGVRIEESENSRSTARRSPADPPSPPRRRAGAHRVGAAAQDDSDPGDEERDRERRGDRAERGRVSRPHDGEHEDQPDVVGLPDGRHARVGVIADLLRTLAASSGELPEAGAEIGARKHGIERKPGEREDQRQCIEVHGQTSSPSGARASRTSVQPTAAVSPR
jgi:hypothetical protein